MILFKKGADLRKYLDSQRTNEIKIGFVPTMGALHEGHVSLIKSAKSEKQLVVCSIFVNPTQFNDPADFRKYPMTLDADIAKLEAASCDILFHPNVQDMYPEGTGGEHHYDLGYLESILEGKYRPGHFQGVSWIVDKLLSIVEPDNLYIGQKDYQQCMVIKRLLEITGRDKTTTIHISPTLREQDGLAMSSRNMRLDPQLRSNANTIHLALSGIKKHLHEGELSTIKKSATDLLNKKSFKVDYVEIADATTLKAVSNWDGKQKLVAVVAAFLGDVRLIDNILLN